jgi:GH43 family beta-xylosidase
MGLLHAREDADLLDPGSWTKARQPVFQTDYTLQLESAWWRLAGRHSFTPPRQARPEESFRRLD